ncbi:MAG: outer membrane beta-barrel protein [Leptospiraceae bacterium]|nr:outer membrane beta-barrel protein [Leptospiraceae bacterium]
MYSILISGGYAQAREDSFPLDIGSGFALGLHAGYQPVHANLYPAAGDQVATTPDVYFAGLNFRYKYKFLFVRGGAEGGIAYPSATGKTTTGGNVTMSVTSVHAPVSVGLNLPLRNRSSLYMGFGYSHFIGIYNIKNDLADSTFPVSTGGTHILLGTEIKLTEKGHITLEWMQTFGLSAPVGNGTLKTRQFDLTGSRFMMGYAYYFVL